uniref:Uncharacterized protein n=1 Tax=Oryza sativa subsp. japonica TaxID=39947 RepID=Q2QSJ9_ORYSJ|nr:hypothetical protein LOC_Os12g23849 [Oryza sativa Japonica Group]
MATLAIAAMAAVAVAALAIAAAAMVAVAERTTSLAILLFREEKYLQ